MKLILGSASLFKREELEKAGYQFDVMTADIDEKAIRHDDFYKLPLLLAEAKAEALLPKIEEPAVLITNDLIVICKGELHEKPESEKEIYRRADMYENSPIEIVSGTFVVNTQNGKRTSGLDTSKVVWGKIDRGILKEIIEEGSIFKCAGFNEAMVEHFAVEHDNMDRLRGMPIYQLKELLNEVGYVAD